MWMRRPVATALAVSLTALGLTGCSPSAQPRVVAVVLPSEDGRFADVADELRERLAAAGYAVDVHSTDGDIPAQVTVVGELLAEHPAGLVVWPIDGTSLTPVIDEADPGIQIIALGEMVDDTPRVDRYVAFDAGAAGTRQLTAMLEGLGVVDGAAASAPLSIELFVGSPENAGTEPGYAAIMSGLQPLLDSGTLVIGSGEIALDDVTTLRGNEETAASRMTHILRDHYGADAPDAVLATSDEIARGVSGALLAAGSDPGDGFPIVTGRGAELASLVALLEGRQYATLLEDPRRLGAEAADRLIDMLAGTTPAPPEQTVDNGAAAIPASLVQPAIVRVDDIDDLIIASGYWSRARLDKAIAEFGIEPEPTPTPTATPAP